VAYLLSAVLAHGCQYSNASALLSSGKAHDPTPHFLWLLVRTCAVADLIASLAAFLSDRPCTGRVVGVGAGKARAHMAKALEAARLPRLPSRRSCWR